MNEPLVTKELIKQKITTNNRWAIRAIVALYKRQTDDEKVGAHTNVTNGRGFSKFDAAFMSSLAQQYERKGFLSQAQLDHAKKKLGKYAGQLLEIAKEKALEDIISKNNS